MSRATSVNVLSHDGVYELPQISDGSKRPRISAVRPLSGQGQTFVTVLLVVSIAAILIVQLLLPGKELGAQKQGRANLPPRFKPWHPNLMELQNKIVAIAGRKGSGKSTSARWLLEHCPRVVLFDPLGEHSWIPNAVGDYDAGRELATFLKWAHHQPKFAGRLVPLSGRYSLEVSLECLADNAYRMGDLVLGVEEVPIVSKPGYLPPNFDRIVRLGRHRSVSVIYTAQRLSETARRLTAATDYFWLFAHSEPRDLASISDRCGSDVAAKVVRLGMHDSLIFGVAERKEISQADILRKMVKSIDAASQRHNVTA